MLLQLSAWKVQRKCSDHQMPDEEVADKRTYDRKKECMSGMNRTGSAGVVWGFQPTHLYGRLLTDCTDLHRGERMARHFLFTHTRAIRASVAILPTSQQQ